MGLFRDFVIYFFFRDLQFLSEIAVILVAFSVLMNSNQVARSHMTRTWFIEQEPWGPKKQNVK